jgi:hypothetical protein
MFISCVWISNYVGVDFEDHMFACSFTFLFWFNIAVHWIWCHVQFSPTSEHILLAYGRRHVSLLKSIVIDGETKSPIYTVLEV